MKKLSFRSKQSGGNDGNDILDGGLDGFPDSLDGGGGADNFVYHVIYRTNLGALAFESHWIISNPTDALINQGHWVVSRVEIPDVSRGFTVAAPQADCI